MTEREYIDATNLAKVRALESILRDILPGDDHIPEEDYKEVRRRIWRWQIDLEKVVVCKA